MRCLSCRERERGARRCAGTRRGGLGGKLSDIGSLTVCQFLAAEVGDGNFPVDASAAMQLFIMAGLRDNAGACKVRGRAVRGQPKHTDAFTGKATVVCADMLFLQACMDSQIKILEKGPDGKTQHRLGTGAICWGCGFVGLPSNNDAFDAGKPKRSAYVCTSKRPSERAVSQYMLSGNAV